MHLTQSSRYRWMVLGMAFMAVFAVIGLGRFGYSAVLPSMQKALGLSGAEAGSLQSWNQVGYTVMALIGGILASRFGARIIVSIGLFLTAFAMFGTGLASGLVVPSVARFLTGAGTAIVMGPSVALMAAWFEPRRLGVASGIVPTGGSLALVLVGPVVPRLIAAGGSDGWRLAWYLFGGVTLVVAIAGTLVLRDRPHAQRAVSGPSLTLSDLRDIARSRRAWLLGAIYFLYGFAFLLFFTFFQKRLTTDLGFSSGTAGNLFLVMGALGVIAGVLWGRVSDTIGRGPTMAIVFFLEAAVAVVFRLLAQPAGPCRRFGRVRPVGHGRPRALRRGVWRPLRRPPGRSLVRIHQRVRRFGPDRGPVCRGSYGGQFSIAGALVRSVRRCVHPRRPHVAPAPRFAPSHAQRSCFEPSMKSRSE